MASTGQASAHFPQRMHRFFLYSTPPPFFRPFMASVGQAAAQGAGSQARQTVATNPVDNPPEEEILIPAVFQDSSLCTCRAHAKEHE